MGFRFAPAALREHPMTQRIAVAEKTRERLRALIDGRVGTGADRSDLVRMAVQLIVEEVLEGEARDKLGRERYERAEGEASGYLKRLPEGPDEDS
jgi:Arc/MetJ-type ribon-helix-helix transcriptional regulator